MECSVEGCERPRKYRLYCKPHYEAVHPRPDRRRALVCIDCFEDFKAVPRRRKTMMCPACALLHSIRARRREVDPLPHPAPIERACLDCGAVVVGYTRCSGCAASRRRANSGNYRRRARLYGVAYEPITPRAVFERDDWVCQLCMDPIDPELKYPHAKSASLDHRIPLSRGGPHLWDNVQASHLVCNERKRNSLGEGSQDHGIS